MTDSDPDLPDNEDDAAPTAAELEAAGQNSMFGGPDSGATSDPPPAAPAAPEPQTAAPSVS
ncbi:MAG: hypothetical protein AAFZ11_15015, partial [Pseudomonadota bacterium]